ncbi:carbohydrate porin [Sphingomonas sp. MMS24-J13]|uniref:carbohydrate porin n=1 Tax=Sphingomonas sp. MMS24-J13 TaxID=3238686 RepID=UPI00384F1966
MLVGDGQLPHAAPEAIGEAYYQWQVAKPLALALDYQIIGNPAYNRDRGPISVFGMRLHAAF